MTLYDLDGVSRCVWRRCLQSKANITFAIRRMTPFLCSSAVVGVVVYKQKIEVTAVIVENALSHSKQARPNGRVWMWFVSFLAGYVERNMKTLLAGGLKYLQ